MIGTFALCIGLKLVVLLLDSKVRLFMGDSGTYLVSAVYHGVPRDRSYTYPLLIWLSAGVTGSIYTLLALQTLAGAATATLVCFIADRIFAARRWIAVVAAVAVTLDPSQLFYERMVMTESSGTFVLIASVAMALWYLRTGLVRCLLGCIFLGLIFASLRTALIPIALAIGPLAVLVRLAAATPRRLVLRHLIVAIVATGSLHGIYQVAYGIGTRGDAAYIRDAGLFQLGLVAPLLQAGDFRDTGIDPKLLDDVQVPLSDPRAREAQLWAPHGLIDVLKSKTGDQANRVAASIAHRAIARDPLGLIRLGWATMLDYFDASERHARLQSDLGSDQAPDERTIEVLRTHFHYDAIGVAQMPSPVYDYFSATASWLVVDYFTLMPLSFAVIVLCWRTRCKEGLLIGFVGIGLVGGQFLFSHIISFRYLHPFAVFVVLCAALIVDRSAFRTAKTKGPQKRAL